MPLLCSTLLKTDWTFLIHCNNVECAVAKTKTTQRNYPRLKNETKLAYANFEKSVEAEITINPKSFWRFINSHKSSSRIPGNMVLEGVELLQPQDIVNSLGYQFSRVFRSSTSIPMAIFSKCPSFNILDVTIDDVISRASKLKCDMTSGNEGF
ncbi:hypothetical protein QE152_g19895 [Popillia japonica]|uniref:Uncharacterized protein n=1 Tax=Popillia japonica TaxID=7064 RepID=A0AAW1KR53_POPJA